MTHQHIKAEDQPKLIAELVNGAPLLIEVIAGRIGQMPQVERDTASQELIEFIAQMDELSYSQFESRLAKAMRMGDAQLRKQVKATKKAEKDEGDGEGFISTFGGMIKDYMVEYLYDPDTDRASLAWRDPSGKVETGYSVIIDGQKYVPRQPDEVVRSGAILFPSKLGEKKDTRTLTAMILSFIRRVYLFPDVLTPKIIAYWILVSWVYDSFPAVPYLRANGEPGSGKSELMLRIALICNRRFIASGASSTSSLFRTMQSYNFPTLFLDEMDQSKSDAASDIAKLLNQGAMRDGAPITKSVEVVIDGKKTYEVEVYKVYCPKLLAMQGYFWDRAIETRCLSIQLQPRDPIELKAAHIPYHITEEMKREAVAMRNLLLRWRLETWRYREMKEEYINENISSRLNQVTWPMQALAEEDGNTELRHEINSFLEEYYRFLTQDKNMTVEARIIEAMWTIYKYPDTHSEMVEREADGREKIKIGHISKMANQIIAWMNMEEDEDEDDGGDANKQKASFKKAKFEMSPQKVGRRLRDKLQIETSERSKDGYSAYWNQIHMEALAKRYGINVDGLEPPVKKAEATTGQPQTAQTQKPAPVAKPKQAYLPSENEDGG